MLAACSSTPKPPPVEPNDTGLPVDTDVPTDTDIEEMPPSEGFAGFTIGPDPDPALPTDGTLRVLLLGLDADVAMHLQRLFVDRGTFTEVTVQSQATGGLLEHHYGWTGRDQRLAVLDQSWDYVGLADIPGRDASEPELHFAGALGLADEVRSRGATPLLVQTSTTATSAERQAAESIHWRVANGTGSVAVAASTVLSELGVTGDSQAWGFAGALYTALTGDDAAELPSWPVESGALAAAIHDQHEADPNTVHYDGPWSGAVRVEAQEPDPTYRFLISGTSSERGYRRALRRLLEREELAHHDEDIGNCNPYRTVDEACRDLAAPFFQAEVFQSMYARGYEVSADSVRTAGHSPWLQVQVYDRHWDSTPNDGVAALDDIHQRSAWSYNDARALGLAWLPQHIAFGRYKLATGQNLLRDGVHATEAVQDGLAAMSYVSRTGLSPTIDGLPANPAAAVQNGEYIVRTMATLSRTGVFMEDIPANRVLPTP